MKPIESIEHRGYTINIYMDEDPPNPRTDFEPMGRMLCFHSRYLLGDRADTKNARIPQLQHSDFNSWEEMKNHLEKEEKATVILPLFLYDHSGLSMNIGAFADPWDSGQVGFIYLTRADILQTWDKKRLSAQLLQLADNSLRAEVETYDHYLTGRVYGYTITGPDVEESSWGHFGFGEIKEIVVECQQIIDRLVDKRF